MKTHSVSGHSVSLVAPPFSTRGPVTATYSTPPKTPEALLCCPLPSPQISALIPLTHSLCLLRQLLLSCPVAAAACCPPPPRKANPLALLFPTKASLCSAYALIKLCTSLTIPPTLPHPTLCEFSLLSLFLCGKSRDAIPPRSSSYRRLRLDTRITPCPQPRARFRPLHPTSPLPTTTSAPHNPIISR